MPKIGGTEELEDARMARRRSRSERNDDRPRRRGPVFSLAAMAVLAAGVWFAPSVAVLTSLRDRPLEAAFAGLQGSIASGSATWGWLNSIEYRDIVVRDGTGVAAFAIDRVSFDRGLVRLASEVLFTRMPDLGTVRLAGVEAVLTVDDGESSLERLLHPWLSAATSGPTPTADVELIDGGVVVFDRRHRDSWRIADIVASGRLTADGIEGWNVAGRLVHAGLAPDHIDAVAIREGLRQGGQGSSTFDRRSIAAAATALLAREGGFSVSSPESDPRGEAAPATALAVATHRLPLGFSSVTSVRFGWPLVVDGLADMRLDLQVAATNPEATDPPRTTWKVGGSIAASELAVLDAETFTERFSADRVEIPVECSVEGDMITIRRLEARSSLFSAELVGRLPLSARGGWEWLERAAENDFTASADVDLAALARSRPGGLEIRPDVRVTGGHLRLAAAAHADGGRRVVESRIGTKDLEATQGQRQLSWTEPFSAWLRGGRDAVAGNFRLDEARLMSPAFEISASGERGATRIEWTADLDRLAREIGEVFDLGGATLAGTSRGSCGLAHAHAAGDTSITLSTSIDGFVLDVPGRDRWSDSQIRLEATGIGRLDDGCLVMEQGHASFVAGEDTAEATLAAPVAVRLGLVPGFGTVPGGAELATEVSIGGDIASWRQRVTAMLPAIDLGGTRLTGGGQVSAALAATGDGWQITRAGGELTNLSVETTDGRRIEEPRVVASMAGTVRPASGGIEISSAEVLTATLSLRSGGCSLLPSEGGSEEGPLLSRLRGSGQWQADVGRVERWLVSPLAAASWPSAGRAWGTFEVLESGGGVNVRVTATGNDLSLASVPASSALGIGDTVAPRELWREPRATFVLEITKDRTSGDGRMIVNALSLESSTASLSASGSVRDVPMRSFVDLTGSASFDWDAVSRLAIPWTGGRVRLAGVGGRPFAIRGPLAPVSTVASRDVPRVSSNDSAAEQQAPIVRDESGSISLPQDWLAAARGLDNGGGQPLTARAVSVRPAPASVDASAWLRAVSLETTLGWQAADMFGIPVDGGDVAVRLLDGQLAFGPFDLAAAGGRLRGNPWLRITPGPIELVVPPGRVVEQLDVSRGMANRFMAWIAPLLGQSTQTSGRVSVDTAGIRLPVGDPFGGEAAGQVMFEGLEVAPGPPAQPLVALVGRLQGLLDPRFAIGEKLVIMRIRPEPIRVQLSDRRLWHDGLVMDVGQVSVRTRGSVAADGTLAMDVEMAFRGDIVGQTPVVAALLRTPLVIPLKGTIDRPQFDAAALDRVFAKIAENTAQAVLGDGINRGLEALFGNPPPPVAPR